MESKNQNFVFSEFENKALTIFLESRRIKHRQARSFRMSDPGDTEAEKQKNELEGIIETKMPISRERFDKRFSELQKSFEFNEYEMRIIALAYIVRGLNSENWCENDLSQYVKVYEHVTDEILRHDGIATESVNTMKQSGIVEVSLGYKLNESAVTFLSGITELSDICIDPHIKGDTNLSVKNFDVYDSDIEVILELLENSGASILLHGLPGTGKTELAKALCKEGGREAKFVRMRSQDGQDSAGSTDFCIFAAARIAAPENHVFIIDEADSVLQASWGWGFRGNRKAWLNKLLDLNKNRLIFIANNIGSTDPSTLRRFSYIVDFKEISQKQRKNIFKETIARLNVNFVTNEMIESVSANKDISIGVFSKTVNDVLGMETTRRERQRFFNKIIDNKSPKNKSLMKELTKKYDSRFVNADTDLEVLVKNAKTFYGKLKDDLVNFNILLMGEPGSGKTEFVKYLAKQTGRQLVVKRASDLLGMYVGESEKNIAAAFAEAQARDAILFMDEADSLFASRKNAVRTWEVSQANELLTQMENFQGILICATNFFENLDEAALRRFARKVKFGPVKEEMLKPLFEKVFGINLNDSEELLLRRIKNLTPGDFYTVSKDQAFNEDKSAKDLIGLLEKESRLKNRDKSISIA